MQRGGQCTLNLEAAAVHMLLLALSDRPMFDDADRAGADVNSWCAWLWHGGPSEPDSEAIGEEGLVPSRDTMVRFVRWLTL